MLNKCQISASQSSPCLIPASPLGWYYHEPQIIQEETDLAKLTILTKTAELICGRLTPVQP